VAEQLAGWKEAIKEGHEIGNHSMTHPCTGNYTFSRNNALENYTLDMIADDIEQADNFIQKNLNIKANSFAYPCGQKFVGRGRDLKTYIPLIADWFISGRGWLGENSNDPLICDMSQLLGTESDGKTFVELKVLIEKTAAEGRWLILAGHEMDDGGRQTTLLSSLESLCKYAKVPENGIWIDTVENIADISLSSVNQVRSIDEEQ
jgi:peptidoglycan/xylan/chitin deacetylase (PgdA/CDA1 family)